VEDLVENSDHTNRNITELMGSYRLLKPYLAVSIVIWTLILLNRSVISYELKDFIVMLDWIYDYRLFFDIFLPINNFKFIESNVSNFMTYFFKLMLTITIHQSQLTGVQVLIKLSISFGNRFRWASSLAIDSLGCLLLPLVDCHDDIYLKII
jgi:hypothetical protein